MKRIFLVLIICSFSINAQNIPFNCDYSAYLFQFNDVFSIDLASGNAYQIATDITPGKINAAAYNPTDGFFWGSLSSPEKSIVRIGKDFQTTTYFIPELPTNNRYIGDISSEGIYYLKGGGTAYYAIDLNPESSDYGKHIAKLSLSKNINNHDWAFNAVDNKLYTVEKTTNILFRIDAESGVIESLGEVPILSGLNYTYGAVYFDVSGRFYVSANQTGTIYVIQHVQDLDGTNAIDSNLFAFGPSSSSNDGARCPTAPVPQENCTNGIDDDGDGLIDCEDPSCSGYAGCPVIQVSSSSSANAGGLESNNRLSEQISKRNFNRAKRNYIFNKSTAKQFSKTSLYAKTKSKGTLQLTDFIPVDIINEDEIIDSSPTDLLNITNATDVYSVDYISNGKAVASLLALKTEKGVYEHTKYICDRLLGAELISVSTIEINEQQFIKSLIRNVEGSLEFVLSLSAKAENNNNNFAIESHWNIDKYESNVPFYNFQIWSSSLDNLLLLGEEVVRLLDIQKPVSSYNNSTPPTVFVRKGTYHNGKLELQIVNTNRSEAVAFDGGLRKTETTDVSYVASTIKLDANYLSNIEVETGNLFDIGFRIGDGIKTPDDLFMSDGPWGYDDAAPSTVVSNYSIQPNEIQFNDDEFPVERNLELVAQTREYVAVYRALTPKFTPIDLSKYKGLALKAKGTGTLIIRLVKASVSNWEVQYKTTIELTDNLQEFYLPFSEFKSKNSIDFSMDDVTSIVFTMMAANGEVETKEMTLKQVRFSQNNTLSIESNAIQETMELAIAKPNPMRIKTKIEFISEENIDAELSVYNQLGVLVKHIKVKTQQGKNEIVLNRENLSSGLYFCNIKSNITQYKTIKLLVE